MAINKITAPSEVPASVSDYQAQNDLLDVLNLAVLGADRVSGSNVVKSSVFNVGGAIYLADADTAITGSASAYVKLTVSVDGLTLAPSFVADLTGVSWNTAYLGYYDVDGNLYVFDEYDAFQAGEITTPHETDTFAKLRHGYAEFYSSGTFIAPESVTTVFVTGVGGGGAGGAGANGASSDTYGAGGGGGGSGAWCFRCPVTVVPGTSYAITIGAGAASTFAALLSLGAGGAGGNASGKTPGTAGSPGAASYPWIKPGSGGSSGATGTDGMWGAGGDGGAGAQSDTPSHTVLGGVKGSGAIGGGAQATAGSAGLYRGAGGGGGGGGLGTGTTQPGKSGGGSTEGRIIVEW